MEEKYGVSESGHAIRKIGMDGGIVYRVIEVPQTGSLCTYELQFFMRTQNEWQTMANYNGPMK